MVVIFVIAVLALLSLYIPVAYLLYTVVGDTAVLAVCAADDASLLAQRLPFSVIAPDTIGTHEHPLVVHDNVLYPVEQLPLHVLELTLAVQLEHVQSLLHTA